MEPSASCAAAIFCSRKILPGRDTSAARSPANRGNRCSSRWTSSFAGANPGQVFHAFDCPAAVPGRHFSVDQGYPHRRIVFFHRRRNEIVGGGPQHLANLLEMAFAERIRFGRKQYAVDIAKQCWRELEGWISN